MKEKIKEMHVSKIKYWALRSLIFIVTSLILWVLIALIYVVILSPIFGGSIFEWLIVGGGGFYSIIIANKISIRIADRFSGTK